MGWLSNITGGGYAKIVDTVLGAYEKIAAGHLGKKELRLELEKLAGAEATRLHDELVAEIEAKERVLVAELQQGDKFTKRARPSIVYVGLVMFVLDVLARYAAHWTGDPIPETQVPAEFWYVWGSVSGAYVLGRSIWDKRGTAVNAIGAPSPASILK
ncbi:MAG: hypothetical protein JSV86_12880 [Gemmatimonadota bacterium]|nr:MAG: hypothetical protein JSV86_12880 [Gemmatimonadota bacterium]